MNIDELKIILKEKGVVGAGGAGFPTYAKLSEKVEIVILNGAECEPLFRVDRNILKNKANEVLKGLNIVVEAIGAKEGIVAFKEHYIESKESVNENIYKFQKLRNVLLKDGYPAGDEVVLVYETTGRLVPQGGIPLNVGVMVINVETALNIYEAVENNNSVTHKYLTISGEVNTPKTLLVPIGTTFEDLINEVGGIKIEDYELLIGGPMTGRLGNINECVTKTTKGIFILPKDNPIVASRNYRLKTELKRAMGVCSQCRMCTDLCPRNLLGHSIEPHKVMNSLSFGLDFNTDVFINAYACCGCNLCSAYSCHQGLNPKEIITELKDKLRKAGIKPKVNAGIKESPDREYRRVPVKRVISRLKLSKYDGDAPISEVLRKFNKVKISSAQSIGKKVRFIVNKGDKLEKGDIIGKIEDKDLGVYLHSSINGIVSEVTLDYVEIRREE